MKFGKIFEKSLKSGIFREVFQTSILKNVAALSYIGLECFLDCIVLSS